MAIFFPLMTYLPFKGLTQRSHRGGHEFNISINFKEV